MQVFYWKDNTSVCLPPGCKPIKGWDDWSLGLVWLFLQCFIDFCKKISYFQRWMFITFASTGYCKVNEIWSCLMCRQNRVKCRQNAVLYRQNFERNYWQRTYFITNNIFRYKSYMKTTATRADWYSVFSVSLCPRLSISTYLFLSLLSFHVLLSPVYLLSPSQSLYSSVAPCLSSSILTFLSLFLYNCLTLHVCSVSSCLLRH